MKFKFSFFNKRIVISWLASYLIVFSVPVFSSLFLYWRAEVTLEKEIQNSSIRMLETLQMSTDEALYTISSLVMNISLSTELTSIVNKSEYDSQESFVPLTFKLARDLNSYKSYNKNITDVFIHFNQLEMGLADNYYSKTEEFFNNIYKNTDVSYNDWFNTISEQGYGKSLVAYENGKVSFVDFIYTLPINSVSEISATVIVRMNTSILENMIMDFAAYKDQSIYILDTNSNCILIYGNNVIPDIKYDDSPNDFHMRKSNKLVTVSITSTMNSWRLFSVIPQRTLNIQLGYLRYLIIINLLFCIIIGGILVVYFVKKHYKPIDTLLSLGKKRVNVKFDNDYLLLNELMKDYVDTKSQLTTIKYNQKIKAKTEILYDLIKGTVQPNIELEKFDINFLSDCFVVSVFKMENAEALFEYDEYLDTYEREATVLLVMTNVLEELISAQNRGYVLRSDGNIVCIISLSVSNLSTCQQDIETAFSEAKLFIEDNFSISFTSYTSEIYKTLDKIPDAYKQAVSMTEAPHFSETSDDLIEKIKVYISENYNDNNLNVASVGNYFNITPYYASNVFKRATDISMLDYIGKYRINKAKEIIKSNNPRLVSVAEAVGFNNVRTFMRAFVKYEGITPGQYKEITGV